MFVPRSETSVMQNRGNGTSDTVGNGERVRNGGFGGRGNSEPDGVDNDESSKAAKGVGNTDIRLYRKRWFLLALFMLYTSNAALPWVQFACLTNIVSRYYNVSRTLVEWTSIMVMAARAFVLIPALFLMDKLGTRKTLIFAGTLCCVGSSIKVFSVSPDRFYLAMIGQIFSALSLVFTYSLIGRVSAAWFSADEISTAGALGCVGEIIGVALSFLLPTQFVSDSMNSEEVERGMRYMHYCYTAWAFVILILVTVFFKSKPERPPSAAQVHIRSKKSQRVYKSVKELLSKPSFLLFVTAQSIFYGSGGNALWTLLNQMIDTNFPKGYTAHTGTIGCANLLSGIPGSVILSYIQDRTRKFKCMALTLSITNCVILALFTVSLKMDNILYVYITFALNGCLMQAYYATTIQMGIELSFPVPEGITVATISVCVELACMIFASLYGIAMRRYGDWKTNICVTFIMALSTIMVCLVPPKFKREELERAAKASSVEVKESSNGSRAKEAVPEITVTMC